MVDIAGRSFADIVQAIIDTGRTRVPLYEGNPDQVVGFALVKDLFYLSTGGGECTVADLIHPILEAPDGMLARDLLQRFKSSQIHIARVNDAAGRFIGIVTLEDIVEELMGEILDEYDTKRVHS
jgi:magnesium and cobalt transporter